MKNWIKILCIVITAVMLTGVFAGCKKEEKEETEKTVKTYFLIFDSNGGEFTDNKKHIYTVNKGEKCKDIVKNLPGVEKQNEYFFRWYSTELQAEYDPELIITSDTVFIAQWYESDVMSESRLQGTWSGNVSMAELIESNEIKELPCDFESDANIKVHFTFEKGKVTVFVTEEDLVSAVPAYLDDLKDNIDKNDDLLYDVVKTAYGLESRKAAKTYTKEHAPYFKKAWRKAVKESIEAFNVKAFAQKLTDSNKRYVLMQKALYKMDAQTNILKISDTELLIAVDNKNGDMFTFTKASGVCSCYKGCSFERKK
ncbi:MAG: hypothetical protein IKU52_02995 [Clostridia bacterium]|nr:hypothetical protein [Clostridia bacterium]